MARDIPDNMQTVRRICSIFARSAMNQGGEVKRYEEQYMTSASPRTSRLLIIIINPSGIARLQCSFLPAVIFSAGWISTFSRVIFDPPLLRLSLTFPPNQRHADNRKYPA
jgi:hypothetical protein